VRLMTEADLALVADEIARGVVRRPVATGAP
jgi:hypothetical protein